MMNSQYNDYMTGSARLLYEHNRRLSKGLDITKEVVDKPKAGLHAHKNRKAHIRAPFKCVWYTIYQINQSLGKAGDNDV